MFWDAVKFGLSSRFQNFKKVTELANKRKSLLTENYGDQTSRPFIVQLMHLARNAALDQHINSGIMTGDFKSYNPIARNTYRRNLEQTELDSIRRAVGRGRSRRRRRGGASTREIAKLVALTLDQIALESSIERPEKALEVADAFAFLVHAEDDDERNRIVGAQLRGVFDEFLTFYASIATQPTRKLIAAVMFSVAKKPFNRYIIAEGSMFGRNNDFVTYINANPDKVNPTVPPSQPPPEADEPPSRMNEVLMAEDAKKQEEIDKAQLERPSRFNEELMADTPGPVPPPAPAPAPAPRPPPPGMHDAIRRDEEAARATAQPPPPAPMISDRYPGRTNEDIERELNELDSTSLDDRARVVRDDVSNLRIRIPPTPAEEDATRSVIIAGLSAIDLINRIPAPPQNTPIDYVAELEQRINRHRLETPPTTPSAIEIEWTEAANAVLFARDLVDPIILDHIAELLTRPELMTAAVPLPVSAAPPVPPSTTQTPIPTPVSTPAPVTPPQIPINESTQTLLTPLPELAQTPEVQPGFEERLAKAKVKFDLLQALRRQAEDSMDTLEVSVTKNKRFKKVKRGRITVSELNKHYESSTFKVDAEKVAKQKVDREARWTRRAANKLVSTQTRRAKVVPEEAAEIADIEKNLTDAETIVNDYKNQLEAARTEFPDEIKDEWWNADIDKRLELEFSYLLRVERALADVPPALRVAPPSIPSDTMKNADDAIAYAKATMERTAKARERLISPPQAPWKPGGRRTKKNKARKSTFRRNRKH